MVLLYTLATVGPFVWIVVLSLRITPDIFANPYGAPVPRTGRSTPTAWFGSNYDVYFFNSLLVVGCAVAILTVVGAMAAHALARYRFIGNRFCYFLIFSTLIFPPQLIIIALYQILIKYRIVRHAHWARAGVRFAQPADHRLHPRRLLQTSVPATSTTQHAWMDIPRCWCSGKSASDCLPAISATIILNTITLWNEFLFAIVLITDNSRRTLPIGILKFMGDQGNDVGMVATGLMISVVPVLLIYFFFSEKLIQGITAGAVK